MRLIWFGFKRANIAGRGCERTLKHYHHHHSCQVSHQSGKVCHKGNSVEIKSSVEKGREPRVFKGVKCELLVQTCALSETNGLVVCRGHQPLLSAAMSRDSTRDILLADPGSLDVPPEKDPPSGRVRSERSVPRSAASMADAKQRKRLRNGQEVVNGAAAPPLRSSKGDQPTEASQLGAEPGKDGQKDPQVETAEVQQEVDDDSEDSDVSEVFEEEEFDEEEDEEDEEELSNGKTR